MLMKNEASPESAYGKHQIPPVADVDLDIKCRVQYFILKVRVPPMYILDEDINWHLCIIVSDWMVCTLPGDC